MQQIWTSLVTEAGLERAALLVVYVLVVVACALALLLQLAWTASRALWRAFYLIDEPAPPPAIQAPPAPRKGGRVA